MTDRKKPGVAFWVAVALAVVVLYVASFGPACWLYARNCLRFQSVNQIYPQNLVRHMRWSKTSVGALHWYANLGAPKNTRMIVTENGWVGISLD